MDIVMAIPSPEECASRIHEFSGHVLDPQIAGDLWPRIEQHKWFLSEKLGRIPARGDTVAHEGFRLGVTRTIGRRVVEVQVDAEEGEE